MRTARLHPTASWRHVAALALLAAFSAAPVFASEPPAATLPAWDQLSTAQREQLTAPVRERWDAEPEQRARMLQHAQRWQQMTPEQRKGARHGMRRWEHLNPEQRTQMRALFERMRGLAPEQRIALKRQWKQMTPEQRRALVQENPPKSEPQPKQAPAN